MRDSRHCPITVSRWSKICPIDRPRQHAYKHRCDRIPKVRQTARAVVPSLSGTLADCARPRGRSLDTKDCAIKKCSARLLTDPQERLPAKVEYALRANTWVLACVRLWLHHRSWLPVFHPVSGTKHGRLFREIDGRTLLAPALTSCRAPGGLTVRRLFLAMQLRKVSGERNTVPERIPRSVSGSRTRAPPGGYAWGAAETTWSRAISATGAGALS